MAPGRVAEPETDSNPDDEETRENTPTVVCPYCAIDIDGFRKATAAFQEDNWTIEIRINCPGCPRRVTIETRPVTVELAATPNEGG